MNDVEEKFFPEVNNIIWLLILLAFINLPLLGSWKLLIENNPKYLYVIAINALLYIPYKRMQKMGFYVNKDNEITKTEFIKNEKFNLNDITKFTTEIKQGRELQDWYTIYKIHLKSGKIITTGDNHLVKYLSKKLNTDADY